VAADLHLILLAHFIGNCLFTCRRNNNQENNVNLWWSTAFNDSHRIDFL